MRSSPVRRLVGAFDVTNIAMEPYMEGALPFVTRFPRKTCDVLPPVLAERRGAPTFWGGLGWESEQDGHEKQRFKWGYKPFK